MSKNISVLAVEERTPWALREVKKCMGRSVSGNRIRDMKRKGENIAASLGGARRSDSGDEVDGNDGCGNGDGGGIHIVLVVVVEAPSDMITLHSWTPQYKTDFFR